VIADPQPSENVPEWEQVASATVAAEHILLAAHALRLGGMWRTGWMAGAPKVRAHLGLREHERIVAFLYLGTRPPDATVPPRPPVDLGEVVTEL